MISFRAEYTNWNACDYVDNVQLWSLAIKMRELRRIEKSFFEPCDKNNLKWLNRLFYDCVRQLKWLHLTHQQCHGDIRLDNILIDPTSFDHSALIDGSPIDPPVLNYHGDEPWIFWLIDYELSSKCNTQLISWNHHSHGKQLCCYDDCRQLADLISKLGRKSKEHSLAAIVEEENENDREGATIGNANATCSEVGKCCCSAKSDEAYRHQMWSFLPKTEMPYESLDCIQYVVNAEAAAVHDSGGDDMVNLTLKPKKKSGRKLLKG